MNSKLARSRATSKAPSSASTSTGKRGREAQHLASRSADWLQGSIGNGAVARLLSREADSSTSRGRAVDEVLIASPDGDFNAATIVGQLRRAINSSEQTVRPDMSQMSYMGSVSMEAVRSVDAKSVIAVLDHKTPEEIATIQALYVAKEGRTLTTDLFGLGESNTKSSLSAAEAQRIRVVLAGTAGSAQANRSTADALELKSLLAGGLDKAAIERIMALHRRPGAEIDAMDKAYLSETGTSLPETLGAKLTGLQKSRLYELLDGNFAKADAIAIEAIRRQLEGAIKDPSLADPLNHIDKENSEHKAAALADIGQIVELNKAEAIAGMKDGETTQAAVAKRMSSILEVEGGEEGTTVGSLLTKSLGQAGATINALTNPAAGAEAANQLLQMEVEANTTSIKIAGVLRGLRAQAVRDVANSLGARPNATPADDRLAVDALATRYINDFHKVYNEIRGEHRSYDAIYQSASNDGQDLIVGLTVGHGEINPLDGIDVAIRGKNPAQAKEILAKLPNQEAVRDLEARYNAQHEIPLRVALVGGDTYSENGPVGLLGGADRAEGKQQLSKPSKAEMGTQAEVFWLQAGASAEVKAVERDQGLTGALREIGDDPETQVIMNETKGDFDSLATLWSLTEDPARKDAILRTMRKLRSTLKADESAYVSETAALRSQLQGYLTIAIQTALTIALPELSILAELAANLAIGVASEALATGEINLEMLGRNVKSGLYGFVGSKLGVGALTATTAKAMSSVEGAVISTIRREALEHNFAVTFVGNYVGGTAATSIANGQNEFSFVGAGAAFVGHTAGFAAKAALHGESPVPGKEPAPSDNGTTTELRAGETTTPPEPATPPTAALDAGVPSTDAALPNVTGDSSTPAGTGAVASPEPVAASPAAAPEPAGPLAARPEPVAASSAAAKSGGARDEALPGKRGNGSGAQEDGPKRVPMPDETNSQIESRRVDLAKTQNEVEGLERLLVKAEKYAPSEVAQTQKRIRLAKDKLAAQQDGLARAEARPAIDKLLANLDSLEFEGLGDIYQFSVDALKGIATSNTGEVTHHLQNVSDVWTSDATDNYASKNFAGETPPTVVVPSEKLTADGQRNFSGNWENGKFTDTKNVDIFSGDQGSNVQTPTEISGDNIVVGGQRGATLDEFGKWKLPADGSLTSDKRSPQYFDPTEQRDFRMHSPKDWAGWESQNEPMTLHERYAMWAYSDDASTGVNKHLREGSSDAPLYGEKNIANAFVSEIDAAMRPVPVDTQVVRMVDSNALGSFGVSNLSELTSRIGATYRDDAVISTGVASAWGESKAIKLVIDTPAGARGRYIGPDAEVATDKAGQDAIESQRKNPLETPASDVASNPNEFEFVLERGTAMEILDVQGPSAPEAPWTVHMRVVSQGTVPSRAHR